MSFGGYSMSETCFNYIKEILPEGKTILELGSGWGTGELAKHYKMFSIESSLEWIDKYNSTYIYAPIKYYNDFDFKAPEIPKNVGWFDPEIVKKNLPKGYDLIFVDGPWGPHGRGGFYKYLDWFNTDVPIILDDVNRIAEKALIKKVSEKLNKPYKLLSDGVTGVIK